MSYTKLQRDNVVRLVVEIATQAAARVGVAASVSSDPDGSVVVRFANPDQPAVSRAP